MKIKKMDELINGKSTVAISGHVRPDGDCAGSTLAVYNYIKDNYPKVDVDLFLESLPDSFLFLKNSDKINSEYDKKPGHELFIAMDCGDIDRLGKASKYFEAADYTICLDHHVTNTDFADENFIYPSLSSTSELVYEMLEPKKISKEIAMCLYLGIAHDTGVFQYSCTSSRTMEIAGSLMDMGIDFPGIIDGTFYQKTYDENRILGCALLKSRLHMDGLVISSVLESDEMEKYNVTPKNLDGIVSQLRITNGVDVAIFMYQADNGKYKVSLRSSKIADVSKIAQYFGGGGHVRAAGMTMEGDSSQILGRVLDMLREMYADGDTQKK